MKWLKYLLLCIPLAASAQVNTEGWFTGATKYKTTSENVIVSWEPHADNTAWQGNFVFDLQVIYYQRQETILDVKAIDALEYTFTLPRVGHYLVRLRACEASNPIVCSDWTQGWDSTLTVNGQPLDGWWVFVWVGSPTNPGVE